MSIEHSLNRLAAIQAELTKPSTAEAERLRAFRVTKTIVIPVLPTRSNKSSATFSPVS